MESIPDKLQPGGTSYDLVYGNLGVCDYLEELGEQLGSFGKPFPELLEDCFQIIADHEQDLSQRFIDFLQETPHVNLIGSPQTDPETRVSTIAFTVQDHSPAQITEALANAHIGIRHGSFYAPRLIESLGLSEQGGVIRISLVHYNTLSEINHLIEHLQQLLP
ncbi:MAG: aminotransferase class V-fold PLP-dependent enzyme [Prochlorotrichaceae cyanobacterium]